MADGIPFPQAPQYRAPNPLQQMSEMSALAQRQQSMEQQAIAMQAKMAVGQHMQANMDQQTGEFNKDGFLKSLATDPAAAPAFMDVYHMMLQNGEIEARTAGQLLLNQSSRMDLEAKALQPLARKIADGDNLTQSDFAGAVGSLMSSGYYKDRNEALQTLVQAGGGIAPNDAKGWNKLTTRLLQRNEAGRATLKDNMLGIEQAYAPVTQRSALGTEFSTPAFQAPGAMPPGSAEMFGQKPVREMTVGGASAPRAAAVGEAESPSAPSPTYESDVPAGARRMGAAPQYKQYSDYMADTEGKHWLRKEQAERSDAADIASRLATQMKQQEELLRQYEQGPGMAVRQKIAENLAPFVPASTIQSLMGAKSNSDALAAAQAARKEIFTAMTSQLKTALPNQRYTNFDLQSMEKAFYGPETKKEAINVIMKHMKNVVDITKEEADAANQYADWSIENPTNKHAFNQGRLGESVRKWLKHRGLLREGDVDVTKKPGE